MRARVCVCWRLGRRCVTSRRLCARSHARVSTRKSKRPQTKRERRQNFATGARSRLCKIYNGRADGENSILEEAAATARALQQPCNLCLCGGGGAKTAARPPLDGRSSSRARAPMVTAADFRALLLFEKLRVCASVCRRLNHADEQPRARAVEKQKLALASHRARACQNAACWRAPLSSALSSSSASLSSSTTRARFLLRKRLDRWRAARVVNGDGLQEKRAMLRAYFPAAIHTAKRPDQIRHFFNLLKADFGRRLASVCNAVGQRSFFCASFV